MTLALISGTPCVLCGRQAVDVAHIESRAQRPDMKFDPGNVMALCRECHEKADNQQLFDWEREYDQLFIYRKGTDELLARVPLVYTDEQYGELELAEWVAGASLNALEAVCGGMDEKQAEYDEMRCRIAAELHQRMGLYGQKWQDHAAAILHRSPDTVRQYAFIWERLGAYVADAPEMFNIGIQLLREAARSEEPEKTLTEFYEQRMAGRSVQGLLQERASCDEHDMRCARCGSRCGYCPL